MSLVADRGFQSLTVRPEFLWAFFGGGIFARIGSLLDERLHGLDAHRKFELHNVIPLMSVVSPFDGPTENNRR